MRRGSSPAFHPALCRRRIPPFPLQGGADALDLRPGYREAGTTEGFPHPSHVGHRPIERRVQPDRIVRFEKCAAIAGIEIGFHRKPLGEDDVMAIEFKVVVGNFRTRHLSDPTAVHQMANWDKHILGEDRMIG